MANPEHVEIVRQGAEAISAFQEKNDYGRLDLIDADLSNADLSGTVFANIDLSQAMGLREVNHRGPSTIGVDTLFLSNGKIPEIFLRGCGLPDDFIAYVPSFDGNAFEFYSCFISYNHG